MHFVSNTKLTETCPHCAKSRTIVRTWHKEDLDFPVKGYRCIVNAPILHCDNCGQMVLDNRIAMIKAIYQDWLQDALTRREMTWTTKH